MNYKMIFIAAIICATYYHTPLNAYIYGGAVFKTENNQLICIFQDQHWVDESQDMPAWEAQANIQQRNDLLQIGQELNDNVSFIVEDTDDLRSTIHFKRQPYTIHHRTGDTIRRMTTPEGEHIEERDLSKMQVIQSLVPQIRSLDIKATNVEVRSWVLGEKPTIAAEEQYLKTITDNIRSTVQRTVNNKNMVAYYNSTWKKMGEYNRNIDALAGAFSLDKNQATVQDVMRHAQKSLTDSGKGNLFQDFSLLRDAALIDMYAQFNTDKNLNEGFPIVINVLGGWHGYRVGTTQENILHRTKIFEENFVENTETDHPAPLNIAQFFARFFKQFPQYNKLKKKTCSMGQCIIL